MRREKIRKFESAECKNVICDVECVRHFETKVSTNEDSVRGNLLSGSNKEPNLWHSRRGRVWVSVHNRSAV
jgi:hypothetical protein